MKLVTYLADGNRGLGAMLDGSHILDLGSAIAFRYESEGADSRRASEISAAAIGRDMAEFLEAGPAASRLARESVDAAAAARPGDSLYDRAIVALDTVRLEAPVPKPGKVIGIGGNYPELRATWPKPPVSPPLFQKARSCVVGPEDDVVIPRRSTYVQPELELVAVIGKRCRNVPVDEAWDVVAGYSIGNDLTAIDILMSNWVMRKRPDIEQFGLPGEAPFNLGLAFEAKSFDTFGVLGPCLVTAGDIDPTDLDMQFSVNGEVIQSGNTGDMIVSIPEIIAFTTSVCTLEPGDLIYSGARGHLPAVKAGDEMNHAIEGIGEFTTRCVAEPAS